MLGSGHLSGYRLQDPALEAQVIAALEKLADPQVFAQKYGVETSGEVLLFAMGDGNHSLATAKAVWEELKPAVGMDHPARYALVEIENVHDEGLQFEPIHRVLFGLKGDPFAALRDFFGAGVRFTPVKDYQAGIRAHRAAGRPAISGDCFRAALLGGGAAPAIFQPGSRHPAAIRGRNVEERPGEERGLRARRGHRLQVGRRSRATWACCCRAWKKATCSRR